MLGDGLERAGGQALDRQIEACEARCAQKREELAALMQAQFQAMRALSALGLVDPRQKTAIAQANNWTAIGEAARRVLARADAT
jgi:hypothetical protein